MYPVDAHTLVDVAAVHQSPTTSQASFNSRNYGAVSTTPVVSIEADQANDLSQAPRTAAAAGGGITKQANDTANTLQSLNATLNRLQAEITLLPNEASPSSSSQNHRQQQQQQQQSEQQHQQQISGQQIVESKSAQKVIEASNRPSPSLSSSPSTSSSRPVKESFTLNRLKLLNATLLNPPITAVESSSSSPPPPPPLANRPPSTGKAFSSSSSPSSSTSVDHRPPSSIIPAANQLHVENKARPAPAVGTSASSSPSLSLDQQQPQAEQLPQAGTVAARLKAIRDRIRVEL